MTKWHYFWIGFKASALLIVLFTLLFGEVTCWPMKQPLWKHSVLYLLVVISFVIALISDFRLMWM